MSSIFSFQPAKEETYTKKMTMVITSLLSSLLTSGIVYGYSGIYYVLLDYGAFAEQCAEGEESPCSAQTNSLTAAYTIGVSSISGAALFIGILLDSCGPRWTSMIGSLVFASGLICFAIAQSISSYLYYAAFFLISVGGPCTWTAMVNFSEHFPSMSAIIISSQTCGFDMSSFVLFFMGKIVSGLGVPLSTVMFSYLVVPAAVFFTAFFVFPDEPYEREKVSESDSSGELHRLYILRSQSKQTMEEGEYAPLENEKFEVNKPDDIFNTPLLTQLKSHVFWYQALVMGYLIMRSNFFISAVTSQVEYSLLSRQSPPFSDSDTAADEAETYIDIFNYILPIGGALTVPLAGWLLSELGIVSSFIATGAIMAAVSFINLLFWIPLYYQVLSFLFYSVVRPLIYCIASAFIAWLFGFRSFGRLYGISRLVSALTTILQYPISSCVESYLDGNYFDVNLIFLIIELVVVTVIFPIYLWKRVFYGYFFKPPYMNIAQQR